VLRALGWWLSPLAPYNAIGLLLLVALPPLEPRERRLAAQVLGVVLSTLLGVAVQAKFFGYHFAPRSCSRASRRLGLWKLWLRLRERPLAAVAAAALLALASQVEVRGLPSVRAFWARTPARLTAWLDRERWPEVADRLYSGDDVDARANRAAAAWIARHTPADATLFVFGFEPVLYDLSERAPASRYVYNAPQRAAWSAAAHRPVLLRELAARPPAAVVVVHGDPLPAVTGDALDSAAALAGFPALARWLDEGYALGARFGDLEILPRG
jgi:hypothetical protein